MDKIITMGIDQSYTSTGYCIFDGNELIKCGLFKTKKDKLDANDTFNRSWKIANKLLQVAREFNVSHARAEGLAFGMRGSATRDLAGLQFTIYNQMVFVGEISMDIISPSSVKKFATGDGRAKKEELLKALPQNITDLFIDDLGAKKTSGLYDLVDAYWIGKTNISELLPS